MALPPRSLLAGVCLIAFIDFLSLPMNGSHKMSSVAQLEQPEQHKQSLKTVGDFRLEFAHLSLEIMKKDTNQAANASTHINIGPFVNLTNEALDTIGVRGVYDDLFRQDDKFVAAMNEAAQAKGLTFRARLAPRDRQQPHMEYTGIPNDRLIPRGMPYWCLGCWWWDVHWVGAITADKLLRDGSLRLDDKSNRRIYDGAAFFKEYRTMMRSKEKMPDLMPMHAIHGFIWHYVASTRLDDDLEYPTDLAYAFCGEHLFKNEPIRHVRNDAARECRHGFGHAVYYLVFLLGDDNLLRGMLTKANRRIIDPRIQFRMGVGYELSEESRCLGYKICEGAPSEGARLDCFKGFDHSRGMFSSGRNAGRDKELQKVYANDRNKCKEERTDPNSIESRRDIF